MTEACAASLVWVTNVFGSRCVEAFIEPENVNSLRLAARLGMCDTGETRDGACRYMMR